MTDRTTRFLLAAIALGLWMNVVGDWLRPTPVQAQSDLRQIERAVEDIERSVGGIERSVGGIERSLEGIERGSCANRTIC